MDERLVMMVCTIELNCSTRLNTPLTREDRVSMASPIMTEMKMSCRVFPVTKGSKRLEGTMS